MKSHFYISMNKIHHVAALDSIGKLYEHINQLVVAEFCSISTFDKLSQISVFAVFSQQKELVRGSKVTFIFKVFRKVLHDNSPVFVETQVLYFGRSIVLICEIYMQ